MTLWLIILIVLIAVAIWLVPMPAALQKLLIAVAVVVFFVWLVGLLGLFDRDGPSLRGSRHPDDGTIFRDR